MSVDPQKSDACPPAEAVPKDTLSAERMQTILRRLNDGFYDVDEVRTAVARRVVLDIGNSRPE